MVRFSIDVIKSLMAQPNNIRNISVIAHVDHGKTTLSDSLIQKAGIIPESAAGSRLTLDTTKEEIERGITIKATAISLYYSLPDPVTEAETPHLINLIDSPGHVDFSSEVSAALRVTDGALVVVDCVEGKCVQTVTVLRQALAERVTPVLVLNKIDRAFLELQLSAEEAYQRFAATIADINAVIDSDGDDDTGSASTAGKVSLLSPERGNVAFASAVAGWGFTLDVFARKYAAKFGIDAAKLVGKLWGENYYDAETKRWTSSSISESGKPLKRGFVQFVLEPIMSTLGLAFSSEKNDEDRLKLVARMEKEKVRLSEEEKALVGKAMIKVCMRRWLPLGDALLEMIVRHLPSPAAAQKARLEVLYSGPTTDAAAQGIAACDPAADVVVFVSKMVPVPGSVSRFVAFGRVFSGTVRPGQNVRIMTADYVPGQPDGLFTNIRIRSTLLMMGASIENLDCCTAGNVVGLVGVDEYLSKCGTITTSATALPIRTLSFKVSPVVRVSIRPANPSDLPKVVEGLRRLNKSDPMVQIVFSRETGEMVVCGAGELHLEVVLKDLEAFAGVPIVAEQPAVTYRETITAPSAAVCLAKSANKLNRLVVHAEPIDEDLLADLEQSADALQPKHLVEAHGWDSTQARKVWGCAPAAGNGSSSSQGSQSRGTNLLVDGTKSIQNIGDLRDSATAGLEALASQGVLCGEPMRGVKFVVDDAVLHPDAPHRGTAQLLPAVRRALSAAVLSAQPRLVEPIFTCEISCPPTAPIGAIYTLLHKRRGTVYSEGPSGAALYTIRAHLPVAESFGFASALRAATSGQAFPQCVFSHWQLVPSDPLEAGSKASEIVAAVRQRKNLGALPPLEHFIDRL